MPAKKGLVGATLGGQYFLKRMAGSGGMADVYQAFDRHRQHDVAVKVMQPDKAGNERFIESFAKEAILLSKLEHKNIVRFYEVKQDGSVIFLVMDWIEGSDLASLMARRGHPFKVNEVAHYLGCVQRALHYAHQFKVYHCDIKPANIMIKDADNEVLLTDFGVALIAHERGHAGTYPYMAPERFKTGEVGVQTDIYALGVTLYELLSGRLPFQARTLKQLILQHGNEPPPPLRQINPTVPQSVVNVIEKALAKDPRNRYDSATALWMDFERARGTVSQASFLHGLQGENAQKQISIPTNGLEIGRSLTNGLRLRDPSVSRNHAVITSDDVGFYIKDETSALGTLVNGRRIPVGKRTSLTNGDRIQIGSQVFEFRIPNN